MKKIALTVAALTMFATVAHATTTIQTIGNFTYINSYGANGYSSTTCQKVGNFIYCN